MCSKLVFQLFTLLLIAVFVYSKPESCEIGKSNREYCEEYTKKRPCPLIQCITGTVSLVKPDAVVAVIKLLVNILPSILTLILRILKLNERLQKNKHFIFIHVLQ